MTVYVSDSDIIVSDETLYSLQSQLRKLGQGVSRKVFDLGDGTVLKVCINPDSFAGNNLSEWQTWQRVKGTEWEEHFSECIAVSETGEWLIQRAIESPFEDVSHDQWSEWYRTIGKRIGAELGIGDLHPGNVGIDIYGNVKVIDYAYGGNCDLDWLAESECSSCKLPTPCNCDDCDCEECNPEGCNCGTFDGCNWTECKVCQSNRINRNRFAVVQAKKWVLSLKVCSAHYVTRKAWSLGARNRFLEINGQERMFVRFNGKEVLARIS